MRSFLPDRALPAHFPDAFRNPAKHKKSVQLIYTGFSLAEETFYD